MVFTAPGENEGVARKDPISSVITTQLASFNNNLKHSVTIGIAGPNGNIPAVLRPSDAVRPPKRINQIQLGPDSLPPGGLQNNDVFFDIRLTGAGVHFYHRIALFLTVQNILPVTGTVGQNTVYPLLAFWFFNRLEIMSDGSVTDDTIYPEHMYLDYLATTEPAEKSGTAPGVNMTTGSPPDNYVLDNMTTYDESLTGIAPDSSVNYLVPVNSFLTTGHILVPGKQQDNRIRCYLAQDPYATYTPAFSVANVHPLLLSGVQCIVTGPIFQGSVVEKIARISKMSIFTSRVYAHERQLISVNGVLPNSQIADASLTSFNGEYAMLTVYLQQSTATKQQQYSSNQIATTATLGWQPLAFLSLNDSSGNPVGYKNIQAEYIKYGWAGKELNNTAIWYQKNIYPLIYAAELCHVYKEGKSGGGLVLDSNFTLQSVSGAIDPGAGTSFVLTVLGLRYAIYQRSTGGTFKFTKL